MRNNRLILFIGLGVGVVWFIMQKMAVAGVPASVIPKRVPGFSSSSSGSFYAGSGSSRATVEDIIRPDDKKPVKVPEYKEPDIPDYIEKPSTGGNSGSDYTVNPGSSIGEDFISPRLRPKPGLSKTMPNMFIPNFGGGGLGHPGAGGRLPRIALPGNIQDVINEHEEKPSIGPDAGTVPDEVVENRDWIKVGSERDNATVGTINKPTSVVSGVKQNSGSVGLPLLSDLPKEEPKKVVKPPKSVVDKINRISNSRLNKFA